MKDSKASLDTLTTTTDYLVRVCNKDNPQDKIATSVLHMTQYC